MKFLLVSSLSWIVVLQASAAALPDVDQAQILNEIEHNTHAFAATHKTRSLKSFASFGKGVVKQTTALAEAAFSWSLCGAGLYALLALFENGPIMAYMLNGLIKGAIAGLGWSMISGVVGSFYDLVEQDERQERIKALGRLTAILVTAGCGVYKMSAIMKFIGT